jgi:glutathione peroxidase-family protein
MMLAVLAMMTTPAQAEDKDKEPDAKTLIKRRCAAKWGDDFRMQKYCRANETEAMGAIYDYYTGHGLDMEEPFDARERILIACADKWTDDHGLQWRMVDYCNRKQVEAWESMR